LKFVTVSYIQKLWWHPGGDHFTARSSTLDGAQTVVPTAMTRRPSALALLMAAAVSSETVVLFRFDRVALQAVFNRF